MNEKTKAPDHKYEGGLPLHLLLRHRREALCLRQADIAVLLKVTPEAVGQREAGHRRMELGKLPRLAEALQLDPKGLCIQALAEFHPAVYAVLFAGEAASPDTLALAS